MTTTTRRTTRSASKGGGGDEDTEEANNPSPSTRRTRSASMDETTTIPARRSTRTRSDASSREEHPARSARQQRRRTRSFSVGDHDSTKHQSTRTRGRSAASKDDSDGDDDDAVGLRSTPTSRRGRLASKDLSEKSKGSKNNKDRRKSQPQKDPPEQQPAANDDDDNDNDSIMVDTGIPVKESKEITSTTTTDKKKSSPSVNSTAAKSKKKKAYSTRTTTKANHQVDDVAQEKRVAVVQKKTTTLPTTDSNEELTTTITTTDNTSSSLLLMLPSKPNPAVDVTVHRIRHCHYHPQPILCLAACHDGMIATSRESGHITLQMVVSNKQLWTVAEIAGSSAVPITVMAWTQQHEEKESVLIGASRNEGSLYVVDFWGTNQLTAKTPVPGGGIFCLESVVSSNNMVAAGCQDGSIRIFRVGTKQQQQAATADRFELQAVSTIPSAGAAVLSLACRRRPSQQQGNSDDSMLSLSSSSSSTVLFAGVADGTIRRYDCQTNNYQKNTGGSTTADLSFFSASGVTWKSTLRMTVECYGRSTPTRVWALKAATDGTVVSGDSLGHVQFWDGDTGTLISSFEQNDNKADVLDLDMTADECKVFASGVDSRVVCIERSTSVKDGTKNGHSKWIITQAQRPHTHDVKAVTIVQRTTTTTTKPDGDGNSKAKTMTEILCTGGLDTKLCTYDVANFASRRPRTLYPWPSLKSPIAVAKSARVWTMLRDDRVDLYELAAKQKDPKQMKAPVLVPEADTLVGTVQVQGSANLTCSAISGNGQFLALSDSYALILFLLKWDIDDSATRTIVPARIHVKIPKVTSIVALRFIGDTRLVVATSAGQVLVILLSPQSEDDSNDEVMKVDGAEIGYHAVVEQKLELPRSGSETDQGESTSLLPVYSIVSSADGKWFVTVRNSSSQKDGKIDIFGRIDGDDSYQYWWTLPSLGSAATAVAFLAQDSPQLAVACVDYAAYVFNVAGRCLSEWSENAGYPVTKKLPSEIAHRNDYPVRIGINPASPSSLMVGSFGAIIAMNTEENFPQQCRVFPETHVRRGKKRKRSRSLSESQSADEGDVAEANKETTCAMCLRYNSMLYMDFVDNDEMVIVEQPWLNVVATFPDALQRKVYGT